jgi:hypothetical protein
MVRIIVEGNADCALVNRLLEEKEENTDYKFLGKNGISSVFKTIEKLTPKDFTENKYFAIVDADTSFEDRKSELEICIGNKPIDYFILPNHNDSGDLEAMILETIGDNKIIECFDSYKECIKNEFPDYDIDNKAKLYAYTTILHGKRPEKYIEEDLVISYPNFEELKAKLENLFEGL